MSDENVFSEDMSSLLESCGVLTEASQQMRLIERIGDSNDAAERSELLSALSNICGEFYGKYCRLHMEKRQN